jgi:hypothetical protein
MGGTCRTYEGDVKWDKMLVMITEGKRQLGRTTLDGRTLLILILYKQSGRAWTDSFPLYFMLKQFTQILLKTCHYRRIK